MKNQKGITLTILVFTVIALALIVGSISYSSISNFKMKVYYDMCSDIEILDEKIAIYYLQNKELPVITEETKNISEIITDYSENNINYNPNNSGNLYKIDIRQLENLSLTSTDYYIDEKSHTIYTLNGIDIENEVYYTVPLNYEEVNLTQYK